jgi:cystathionine gamma-synthase/methionine-gamma-lyase
MTIERNARIHLGPASTAVHAGERQTSGNGHPTSSPIHIATAYGYDSAADLDAVFADSTKGYVYSRYGNPTVRGLEEAVAALEGTEDALAYASGMAAIFAAVTQSTSPGESIVVSRDVYGATFSLLQDYLTETGITAHFVDILDLEEVQRVVDEIKPAAILAETASNPLIRVADIPALSGIARAAGAKLVIDNTFVSPILVHPATSGADFVVHSMTKYLGGHGDSTGGIVATSKREADSMRQTLKLTGAILSPFEAWITHRGIKTLPLRMRQHCANAREVVQWLQADSRIDRVYYPGLATDVPEGVFLGEDRGAMLAYEVKNATRDTIFRLLDALRLITPAPTLGDVYSLTLYPAMSSHRGLTPEQRAEIGIRDNLVRLSVGIEDAVDIVADLDQALTAALG